MEGCKYWDAFLVANEVVDSRKKRGVLGILCNLDLEKAYDHVNGDFLDFIMLTMGFREKRRWINLCISTTTLSVLVCSNMNRNMNSILNPT